ncbi:MAG: mannose-6-phosphate isomerase, class I [Treponema sp.]|jgi:mannose-6-phosphate isomerase|nr:mannose-6-phosphate isomerase, class I [Treponema sp.]
MHPVFKLKNQVKHYAWGSPDWIPKLLGEKNPDNKPYAELWMGVHRDGQSQTGCNGKTISLAELIGRDAALYLGKASASAAAGAASLPFLFKLLAADKPLSIQAHPSLEQARAGFERENSAGVPLDAPERNYKDANHKPEIICALTPFKAMAGFRETDEIRALFGAFGMKSLAGVKAALDSGLKAFLQALFALPPEIRRRVCEHAATQERRLCESHPQYRDVWETAASFAERYPSDPAALSPLYLNLIFLEKGEALFLPAGVLHAYIHGLGVELMANSDNVLRGGLTSKCIDLQELFHILTFSAFKPEILHPNPSKYPVTCKEFSLSVMYDQGVWTEDGPAILIVTQGEVGVVSGDEKNSEKTETKLKQGESAFIAAGNAGKLSLNGNFILYIAGIGFV